MTTTSGETTAGEAPPPTPVPAGGQRRLVSVQFRRAAIALYDYDARDLDLPHDARVVVEAERGEEIAWTVGTPAVREPISEGPVRRVLRVANADDLRKVQDHAETERQALRFAAKRSRELNLDMKMVAAEWSHGGGRSSFYFSSESRVDFRGLVKELAQKFKVRVEMRQVGPRDEAKIIGAIGPCGRETCCSSWMRSFAPVSIKMAKDQGLSLNPQKVSGVCGRLLCCLAYEQDTYKELRKKLPKFGKKVMTPEGQGEVIDVLTLRGRVRVRIGDHVSEFAGDECKPLGAQPQVAEPDDDGDDTGPAIDAKPEAPARAEAPKHERPRHDARPAAHGPRDPKPHDRPHHDRPRSDRPPTDQKPGGPPRHERPRPEHKPGEPRPADQQRRHDRPRPDHKPGGPPQGAPKPEPKQGEQPRRHDRPRPDPRRPEHPKPAQPKPEQPKLEQAPSDAAPSAGANAEPPGEAGTPGQDPARHRSRRRRGRGGGGGGGGGGGQPGGPGGSGPSTPPSGAPPA